MSSTYERQASQVSDSFPLRLCATCCSSHLCVILHKSPFLFITKTHPSCTKRPSRHSEYGLRWWFDPGSHHFHVWTSVSRGIWCHRPHPTREPWCGQTSCGIHWMMQRHKLWCRGSDCGVSTGEPKPNGCFKAISSELSPYIHHYCDDIVTVKLSPVLTSGSSLPRQGWGCRRWSLFSSWSYQLEQLHKGR